MLQEKIKVPQDGIKGLKENLTKLRLKFIII